MEVLRPPVSSATSSLSIGHVSPTGRRAERSVEMAEDEEGLREVEDPITPSLGSITRLPRRET